MASQGKRIGLREVRALGPGEILWDAGAGAVAGFCARRKREPHAVAELCDLYLADAGVGRILTRRKVAKKPSTLATDRGRIVRHIKPQLGSMAVAAVMREDIERFMHAVAEGKTAARIKTKKRGLARVR